MYDDVDCQMVLPDDRVPCGTFQTKSLRCCMDRFTITPDGRLILHKRRLVDAPEKEIRPGVVIPQWRAVPVADIDMEYHGDIRMLGEAAAGARLEYVVRFTHGRVEWIRPYDELTEVHQTWFFAKD